MVQWIDSLNESLLKAAEWSGKNLKAIASILALVIVIGAAWAGLNHKQESKASKALVTYAPIERDFNSWKNPEVTKTDDKSQNQKKETKPEVKVDPVALFARMIDYIKNQGDVPASELMVLMASEVTAKLGPQQESELLELAQKTFKPGSRLMDGLLLIKKGDLLANQDQCDQALIQWKNVLSDQKMNYLHDLARLKSGLCFEKLAQFKEAEIQYDQVITGSLAKNEAQKKEIQNARRTDWAIKEAQKLKRALKWSQQQPST